MWTNGSCCCNWWCYIVNESTISSSNVSCYDGIFHWHSNNGNSSSWANILGAKFVSLLIQPIGMDMSFPAACILLSSSLPRHQQGIAGSLVSTFVNYSISIGLGFAGTVEYYTTKNKEPNLSTSIFGMRNAFRMGMGLAGGCCAFFHIHVAPNHQ